MKYIIKFDETGKSVIQAYAKIPARYKELSVEAFIIRHQEGTALHSNFYVDIDKFINSTIRTQPRESYDSLEKILDYVYAANQNILLDTFKELGLDPKYDAFILHTILYIINDYIVEE